MGRRANPGHARRAPKTYGRRRSARPSAWRRPSPAATQQHNLSYRPMRPLASRSSIQATGAGAEIAGNSADAVIPTGGGAHPHPGPEAPPLQIVAPAVDLLAGHLAMSNLRHRRTVHTDRAHNRQLLLIIPTSTRSTSLTSPESQAIDFIIAISWFDGQRCKSDRAPTGYFHPHWPSQPPLTAVIFTRHRLNFMPSIRRLWFPAENIGPSGRRASLRD